MSYAVPTLIGVSSALLVLITVFVAIRLFTRTFLLRSIDWDDALVFISYCLAVVFLSSVFAMTNVGFGSHMDVMSADHFLQFLKLQIVTMHSYIWGFVTVKMSLRSSTSDYFPVSPTDA